MEMTRVTNKVKNAVANLTNFSTNGYRIPVILLGKHKKHCNLVTSVIRNAKRYSINLEKIHLQQRCLEHWNAKHEATNHET